MPSAKCPAVALYAVLSYAAVNKAGRRNSQHSSQRAVESVLLPNPLENKIRGVQVSYVDVQQRTRVAGEIVDHDVAAHLRHVGIARIG